ncbi:MAG: hypothetical protein QM817_24800 [Archangium sp.]
MRRDVWVAALVLVPFVVLIGLTCVGRPQSSEPEMEMARDAAVAPKTQMFTIEAKTQQPLDAGAEVVAGHPSLSRALISNAKQCLTDQHHQRMVEVHFTPTRAGRFADVRVTTQDPYLEACLQDVFEEAQWTVSASATESFAPTSFTFTAE